MGSLGTNNATSATPPAKRLTFAGPRYADYVPWRACSSSSPAAAAAAAAAAPVAGRKPPW